MRQGCGSSVFPLGIFRAWSWLDLEQSALIYPRPLSGAMPLLKGVQPHAEDDGQATQGAGVDDYQGCAATSRAITSVACTGKPIPEVRGCWSRTSLT